MARNPTPVSTPRHVARIVVTHAESLAVQWIEWLRDVGGKQTNTLLNYNQVLRFWLAFCDAHDVEPLRPTLTDFEAFMTRRRARGRKGSVATRNNDATILRNWYTWLHERGHLPENPALDLRGPRRKVKDGDPIPDAHWQIIWDSDLPPRLRAILGLGYYAGLRRAEIDMPTGIVTPTKLVNLVRKGGDEHTVPWFDMADVVYRRLPHLLPEIDVFTSAVEHVRRNYDRVIPWMDPHEMYRAMSKLCDRLGVHRGVAQKPGGRALPYTPHQLRHSTATNLLQAGVPPYQVMRLMNHKSFDTTMGYVRAGASDLREWLDHQ